MKKFFKMLGFVLLAETLTLFINLTLGFSSDTLLRIFCGVCTVGILVGLCAQGGYHIGEQDRRAKAKRSLRTPLLLGAAAILPGQICWVLLLLSRCGILADDFYRIYKILCAPLLPVCNLFSDGLTSSGLPAQGLVILELLTLLPGIGTAVAYVWTRDGKNPEDVLY